MSDDENTIKIIFRKSENFRQVYTIGAIGGHSPYDFRIGFYNDVSNPPENGNVGTVERIIETEIILSPVAALELNQWLSQHIQEYEENFGSPVKASGEQPKQTGKNTNIQGYI
jgi:Protein of unknown function (DUF3467)